MKASIDLHGVAVAVNRMIPIAFLGCLALGIFLSSWFHIGTGILGLLLIANIYFLFVQRRHALLRNFGVLAQGRYLLESLGPELRQYLYSSDTEERPFNRVERSEVYRKALDVDAALSFGSQGQFDATEIKIRHGMFPVPKDKLAPFSVTFGDTRNCANPYSVDKPIMLSAMSFGSLGAQAVQVFSNGVKLAGVPMNTGEGGYPKYHLKGGADLIFQMGTAKFGVRNDDGSLNDRKLEELAAHPQVRMIEIKFSQGAKPGKGGLLPKEKITKEISELRGVPMGKDVVSPPCHIECQDLNSTVAFIKRVQDVSQLPVGIKLALGKQDEFRSLVMAMISQDIFPDWIAIDGAEGGTGAAPKSFLDQVGVPLRPALYSAQQILVECGAREQVKLAAAGKLINAGRMLVAMALGADICYTARGFMLAIGCIQALQCGNNSCPVGITTHKPELQRGLDINLKSQRVVNYVRHVVSDFNQLLAATGHTQATELTPSDLYIPEETALHESFANFASTPVVR